MMQLHLLTVEERELFFESAANELSIPFEIIEKDFWVVWVLERLFSLPDLNNHLTFKGGTSLSKVYGIIQRFSEDIDLSIEKQFFGFDNANDPEKAISKKKQRATLDNLSIACSKYVQNDLSLMLRMAIAEKLETLDGWRLEIDTEDPDDQTLQFEYPSRTLESPKFYLGSLKNHAK